MAARLRTRRRTLLGAGTAVAVVVVGGGVAVATNSPGGTPYRLATASMADVAQDLDSVGTLSAVNRASMSFPVAGTVASVPVRVGSQVAAGQVLASLVEGSLSQQVASAVSSLASARQSLAADEEGQVSASGGSTGSAIGSGSGSGAGSLSTQSLSAVPLAAGSSSASGGSATGRPSAAKPTSGKSGTGKSGTGKSGGSTAALVAAVTRAQQQVTGAQQKLDADLNAAEAALQTCATRLRQAPPTTSPPVTSPPAPTSGPPTSAPAGPSGSSTSTAPTAGPAARPTATPTSSAPGPGGQPSGDPVAACLAAIGQAPDGSQARRDEAALAGVERSLTRAIGALSAAATAAASASAGSGSGAGTAGSTTGSSRGTGGSTTGGAASSGSRTASGSGSTRTASGPASAAQLAADQAQIDAAQAQLTLAQQNAAEATLTSPISGTVAAVGLTAGKSVAASSSSATVTVIGPGQEQVSTTVSLADIDSVKVGDTASVSVDGLSQPLTGKVSSVSILNTSTGTTTTYPVTVLLSPTSTRLYDGSAASVAIRVAQLHDVLTVPSSAVHSVGTLHTVTVLAHGKATVTRVGVGASGLDRTQITSGLAAGAQVVLATVNQPLPTATTLPTRRFTGTTGTGGALGTGLGGTGAGTTRRGGG